MSWWDTKNLGKIASSALKSAQKQIDSVLEIDAQASGSGQGAYSDPGFDSLIPGDDFGWGAYAARPSEKEQKGEKSNVKEEKGGSSKEPEEEKYKKESPPSSPEEEESSWTSWGMKSISTFTGSQRGKKHPASRSQKKGLGKRVKLDTPQEEKSEIKDESSLGLGDVGTGRLFEDSKSVKDTVLESEEENKSESASSEISKSSKVSKSSKDLDIRTISSDPMDMLMDIQRTDSESERRSMTMENPELRTETAEAQTEILEHLAEISEPKFEENDSKSSKPVEQSCDDTNTQKNVDSSDENIVKSESNIEKFPESENVDRPKIDIMPNLPEDDLSENIPAEGDWNEELDSNLEGTAIDEVLDTNLTAENVERSENEQISDSNSKAEFERQKSHTSDEGPASLEFMKTEEIENIDSGLLDLDKSEEIVEMSAEQTSVIHFDSSVEGWDDFEMDKTVGIDEKAKVEESDEKVKTELEQTIEIESETNVIAVETAEIRETETETSIIEPERCENENETREFDSLENETENDGWNASGWDADSGWNETEIKTEEIDLDSENKLIDSKLDVEGTIDEIAIETETDNRETVIEHCDIDTEQGEIDTENREIETESREMESESSSNDEEVGFATSTEPLHTPHIEIEPTEIISLENDEKPVAMISPKESEIVSDISSVDPNLMQPLSVILEPDALQEIEPPSDVIDRHSDVMDRPRDVWDDADLQMVQSDLVDVETENLFTSSEMESSGDVTLTQDSSMSGSEILNQSRETGTETDNSIETLKDSETGDDTMQELDNSASREPEVDPMKESIASSCGSASFVKCTLDDVDSRDDEQSLLSAEMRRERRLDSGQTSADERDDIDTTTSSDIEIISTPNGEYLLDRTMDMSPMRHAFTSIRHASSPMQTHRRTDSNSSSSGHSKHSDGEQLSPGRECEVTKVITLRQPRQRSLSHREGAHRAEELAEKPNKEEIENLTKKLQETKDILEIRENKLVEMSRENVELRESNNNLRTQLSTAQESLENEVLDVNAISKEFGARLKEAEKKLKAVTAERDQFKEKYRESQLALAKAHEDTKLRELVEEKDEQISQLMAEGEKLSKHQLLSNNTIKKLRAKEKEMDSLNTSQAKIIEEQKIEIEKLTNLSNNLESMEEKQADIIDSQNRTVRELEKENQHLRSENEDQKEKLRSVQVAVDAAYTEIHELNKTIASKEAETKELIRKERKSAEEEMMKSQEMMTSITKDSTLVLEQQIEDLQYNLTRAEKDHHRIEDILRQELADLQIRLQEAENRSQDVTQSVSAATRPLLRQIETLQKNHAAQNQVWEKTEKTLTDQLQDVQQQYNYISERDRSNQDKVSDLQSRISSLETSLSVHRQEKSRIVAELETERARANILQDSKQRDAEKIESLKSSFMDEISDLKRQKMLLESQLDAEKSRYENEKKKLASAHEQLLMQKDRSASPVHRSPTPSTTSRTSEISIPLLPPLTQEEVLEHTLMISSQNGSRISLYESLRQNGAANLVDNLQSQLKQKEGELLLLQGEIAELEDTREAMAKELTELTTINDELTEKVGAFEDLKKKNKDLSSRYDALLQMYGEKVEETQELEMDLQDVKDMYKAQIEELLKR